MNMALFLFLTNAPTFQDTCVGFLLGGIGELNKRRQPNFMVVDKSKLLTGFY
jgi:hypothetical protein